MFNNKILVVIPARAGSKGIPRKNIVLVKSKPLISYTLEFVKKISWVDFLVVSSDSAEIQSIASSYGANDTGLRPFDLSGDFVGDLPVLKWETLELEKKTGVKVDYVLMFQPTSPIRDIDFITEATNKLISSNYDSVISVKETNLKYHPLKQLIANNDKLEYYDDHGAGIIARQQLKKTFIRDGVFYGFKRDFLLRSENILSAKSSFLINTGFSLNIDDVEDLELFKKYLDNDEKEINLQ
jgi:CMP-N,N'-diacetyllegionaminic acid synthase